LTTDQHTQATHRSACNTHVPLHLREVVIWHLFRLLITPQFSQVLVSSLAFQNAVSGQLAIFDTDITCNFWIDNGTVNIGTHPVMFRVSNRCINTLYLYAVTLGIFFSHDVFKHVAPIGWLAGAIFKFRAASLIKPKLIRGAVLT